MKKILFLLLILSNVILAQSNEDLFLSANDLYKNEKFEEAIKAYLKIEKDGNVSSELFYNLGNAYYKINKVGPSIYYYEKALKLNPLNEDAKNNLVFAKRLALDNIEELPKSVFQKLNENLLQKLSYNQWAMVVVGFSILGSLLFILFYFSSSPNKKRFYFITSILSFLFLILSLIITYNQFNYFKNNKEAIVFAQESDIRNAPTLNSDKIFTLHEGTKIIVLDSVDDWKKIKIADGKIGWIIAEEIKLLNDF